MSAESTPCPCCLRSESDSTTRLALDELLWRWARRIFEEGRAALWEIYCDGRDALAKWRGEEWRQQALASLLAEHVERFSKETGLAVYLIIAPSWREEAFLPEARVQLLRTIQEALTNVRRHAGACDVHIKLSVDSGHAYIWIEDNGRGFLLSRQIRRFLHRTFPRRGLRRMRDKVRKIGGTFRIKSSPGKGTRIGADIPLNRWTQAMWR